MFRKSFLCGTMLFALLSSMAMAGDLYVKKDTWAKTLLATQTEYSKAFQSGKVAVVKQSPWFATDIQKGKGRDEKLFPEQGPVDVNAKNSAGKSLWHKKNNWKDGNIVKFNYGGQAVIYLYRKLTVASASTNILSLGSDDGIKVWLNGQLVHNNPAMRAVSPGSDRVKLKLKKGANELLIKVNNGGGGYGFYYYLQDNAAEVINQVKADFPANAKTFGRDIGLGDFSEWLQAVNTDAVEDKWFAKTTSRLGGMAANLGAKPADSIATLNQIEKALALENDILSVKEQFVLFNPEALQRSIKYLNRRYADKYVNGDKYLQQLAGYSSGFAAVKAGLEKNEYNAFLKAKEMLAFQRKAMLENPLVDFDEIMLVKRRDNNYALPWNWQGNTSLHGAARKVDNEIAKVSIRDEKAGFKTIYRPKKTDYVGDTTLHWDADRFLFSSFDEQGRWQVFEGKTDGGSVRQVTKSKHKDVDSYDACYLPDERMLFNSTTGYHGVPCVGGNDYVANIHIMNSDGTGVRRLCYDQDNDWYPVVKNDGTVMYLRWEYTDSAHYFSRILMTMNPDGTGQKAMYGSNSYWPNTMFYARPIPGSPSKFVAIVSGHHGVKREGELVIFDTKKGTHSNEGAVQKIPGYKKPVEAKILDNYAGGVWPRFLHPYPLSDKYFIVSMRMKGQKGHGVYLVDAFDNMTLLKKVDNYCLFEPRPLHKTKRPPVIPDKVRTEKKDGTLYIADIYQGKGLVGVPRGTVKKVRVFQYEYAYRNTGGHYVIGMDGPWDVRRLLGTADVYPDGSTMFKVPANRPIAIQPLDADGKALQQFRSWLVVMPGETLACVGCHEDANQAAPTRRNMAQQNPPQTLIPWYGPIRGFSFNREVQPVLDKSCVGCHDGSDPKVPNFSRNQKIQHARFPMSYWNLMKYVRRNGPEGDYHVLTPLEFHANTSRLVQMLEKGHYNVKLDKEAWDRIITWIDLNVPCHGTWNEATNIRPTFTERRYELKKLYSDVDEDIESITFNKDQKPVEFVPPERVSRKKVVVEKVEGWPFATDKAEKMQQDGQCGVVTNLQIADGMTMAFARIPAGKFIKGCNNGYVDETPAAVEIEKPFLIGTTEVTLAQYQAFDPAHKNGFYDMHYKDQVKPGYNMDADKDVPAIRVSWDQAMNYCEWLGKKLGKKVTLPTENQWEWACRAGSDTPFFYGDEDADFGKFANLADLSIKKLAVIGVNPQPIRNPSPYWDWELKDERVNDGVLHLAKAASYKPNAWGLFDMHGNVAEWTRDNYSAKDSRKVVRGGSWYDRPKRARSSYRLQFPQWQRVFNVGFRVIIEE